MVITKPEEINNIIFNEIYIEYSYFCNARCAHCYLDCGPHRPFTNINNELIKRILNEAVQVQEISKKFSLSGGEPTVFWNEMLEVLKYAKDKNYITKIITNGYWAKDHNKTKQKLYDLDNIGLNYLEVSLSEFHLQYVPKTCIRNIIKNIKNTSIVPLINIRITKNSNTSTILERYGIKYLINEDMTIQTLPIIKLGRAAIEIADNDFIYFKNRINEGCSDDLSFCVTPNGNCYPCCNGSELTSIMKIGNIKHNNIKECLTYLNTSFIKRILINGVVVLFRDYPNKFNDCTDKCELCVHILKKTK